MSTTVDGSVTVLSVCLVLVGPTTRWLCRVSHLAALLMRMVASLKLMSRTSSASASPQRIPVPASVSNKRPVVFGGVVDDGGEVLTGQQQHLAAVVCRAARQPDAGTRVGGDVAFEDGFGEHGLE